MEVENDELDIMQKDAPQTEPLKKRASVRLQKKKVPVNSVKSFDVSASARTKPVPDGGLKQSILWQSLRSVNDATISAPATLERASRKRASSDAAGEATLGKKPKTDTADRKEAVNTANRRFIYRYHHVFEPLLPSNTKSFLPGLLRDSAASDNQGYLPFHELDMQPSMIKNGQMKDYQLHGLSFLAWMYHNGMNCILGDEMGLGKTLQTLSLLAYVKEDPTGPRDPSLVVCPLSVLSAWENEAKRWLPNSKTVRLHGSVAERTRIKASLRDDIFDILVTTYECYVLENAWLKSRRWTYCVLDEGHKVKNSDTHVAHTVQGISSLYRLILTGTPVQNNLVELWGLLHWLYPTVFTAASQRLFRDSFDLAKGSYTMAFVEACQKLLNLIMLRRTKATVEASVPPKIEQTVFIPLTEAQRFWYYRLLTRMDTMELKHIFQTEDSLKLDEGRREVYSHLQSQVMSQSAETSRQYKRLMNLLMQLRQLCDHPYLLRDCEPDPYYIGEHIVASSSKVVAVDKLLKDLLPKGEKVLIFSQWTGMLDVMEDFMHLRNIPYARLDGSTPRPRRTLDIKLFQKENSPYKVFLLSTKAGNLGINLTKASHVIMLDCDWNPQNDLQAIGRAHRIGQTKTVKVYRLICRGSVEDQMLDRIRRKLFLSVKLMNSGGSDNSDAESSLGSKALLEILRNGSSALTCPGDGMTLEKFLEAPVEDILDASRSRENARDARIRKDLNDETLHSVLIKEEETEKLLMDAEEEQRQLLAGIAHVHSRLFEGRLVQMGNQKNKEIADEWRNLQKRARKGKETVFINGMTFVVEEEEPATPPKALPKKHGAKFDSEEWCIYCREGGDLICCHFCPRVFHRTCAGFTKQQVQKLPMIPCSQHGCWDCLRNTTDAGGMLLRCQTCPRAWCEDCLGDEFEAVGDNLPQFSLLNHPTRANAYFINCKHCKITAQEDPIWAKEWEIELHKAKKDWQAKLDTL
ncbi:P-loop containing nucleoside triphosphate hydrolase protein [Crepidotus variabilis]|uniref:P-loop containing nucleoside triphosphate hydrolase protein n=1 Tax=Crepidotus variabilis TaxID=179855 RepID=A0A9P6JTB1_9AGAR|nr:P-loop containing nucleoside triphosphate hydrolase protein [Crepidotus variabilis]